MAWALKLANQSSEPLNITTFDTATHATAGDTANEAETGKFIEIGGKTYISVQRSANQRQGTKPL